MRILIQRVKEAKIEIESTIQHHIKKGLCVFVGIEDKDTMEDIQWASAKLIKMRIFQDKQGKSNLSITEVQGDILLMSQFTLFASTIKGNRPSFMKSGHPEHAKKMYDFFCQELKKDSKLKILQGTFGAYCSVHIVNDGPTTIWIDTKNKE